VKRGIPLLCMIAVLCLSWRRPIDGAATAQDEGERTIYLPLVVRSMGGTGLIDDFEGDEVGHAHWSPYGSGLVCSQTTPGYRSDHALRMDLTVPAATYAGCGRPVDPESWVEAEGLRLTWRSDTSGLTFSVALLVPNTYYSSHFVTGGDAWETVFLPWDSFIKGDGSNTPFSSEELPSVWAIDFDVGNWQSPQYGTIWIDDLRLATVSTGAHAYYVSPQGDDAWSGLLASPNADQTDGPFRTLARAQEAVGARLQFPQSQDINVFLREGTYRLDTTLNFNEEDSGRDGYRVVYRNYPGEQPVVSGGEALTDWQYYRDGIYTTQVDWTFYTLYENGVRGVLARYPNQDLSNGLPSGNVYMQVKAPVPGREWEAFYYDPATFPNMQDSSNLEIILWNGGPNGFYHWWTETGPISVSSADQTVELGFDLNHDDFRMIGPGTDYLVQNSLDLLDAPGEFVIQGDTLYYWPRGSGAPEGVVAPRMTRLFYLWGHSDPVHDLAFEGLVVRDTGRDTDSWPGYLSSAAIFLYRAEDIDIVGNQIHNFGGFGVELLGTHMQRVNIESNLFYHGGKSAVVFSGNPMDNVMNDHRENRVVNNYMHHLGEMVGHGSGLRMYSSASNWVAHNLIHDIPAAAIFVSGCVGVPTTKDLAGNAFAFNDIHDVTLDFEDMGPIYISCAGPGTMVHNNHFHNTNVDYAFGSGIYLDEGPISTTISANLVEEFQRPPEQEGYITGLFSAGDVETVIENNIAAYNEVPYGGVILPREYTASGEGAQEPGDTPVNDIDVWRNIFYNNHGPVYAFKYDHPDHRLRQVNNNLFYNPEDVYLVQGLAGVETLAEWQMLDGSGYDQNSLVADPLFVDAQGDDYRLRFDSPAYGLGFEDLNFVDMGLRADFPFSDPSDPLAQLFVTSDVGGHGATLALTAGQQAQLTATARTETGYVADLTAATVTYFSETPAVATVDPTGGVTAQGWGATRIIVTVTRGSESLSLPVFVLVDVDPATASTILPPPSEPPLPVPPFGSPLLESDYDDQFVAFKSNPYARWRIVEEGGDQIYCAPPQPGGTLDSTFSMFGSPYWEDYAASLWVRFGPASQGLVALNTRFNARGWTGYVHSLDFGAAYLGGASQTYCSYWNCDGWWVGTQMPIQPGEWYHLRAEVDGEWVRTFVDGQLIGELMALSTHRTRGYVGLSILEDVEVCVDDVVVRSLDRSPEAMAGAEMVTVTQVGSVYLGPGVTYPVVGDVWIGNNLFVLDRTPDGAWVQIRNDVTTMEGWVAASQVSSMRR
jgi:hypothetical protein